ncbi:MAG: discoidin domain-containing protein, partial [Armatimonadota bacterium]
GGTVKLKPITKLAAPFVLLTMSCTVWAADQQPTAPASSMPVLAVPGLGAVAPVQCVKWQYALNPVETKGSGPVHWAYGTTAAFDGYPSSLAQPYIRAYWNGPAPTEGTPVYAIIDYKRPVAVTKYVHFYRRDDHYYAWKDVDILTSADGENWMLLQTFKNLPRDLSQVLGIDKPTAARFYKIVVTSLTDDVPPLWTFEIETYYGATVGNVTAGIAGTADTTIATQGEPHKLSVRILSPDAPIHGATIRIVSPSGSLEGPQPTSASPAPSATPTSNATP